MSHLITVEQLADRIYLPEEFAERVWRQQDPSRGKTKAESWNADAEWKRDCEYAEQALLRGEAEEGVAAAIALRRAQEKPDPQLYAEQ